jgi:hypothetical protein
MTPRDRAGKRRLGWAALLVGVLALAAWYVLPSSSYEVDPGPFAGDPRCAEVVDRVPETVLDRARDDVRGAGAAAWGDGEVVLRCGVRPLPPNPNLCVTANGVDWVLDEQRARRDGVKVLTTYGRDPAVQVALDPGIDVGGDALVTLNPAVEKIPQKARCVGLDDVR